MLKVIKEHWMQILILILYLVLIIFLIVRLHIERQETKVIYDGGNFKIISCNDTTYIINYDIYGGIHEIKSNDTCGENKAGKTQ